jgi:hypothetical protein
MSGLKGFFLVAVAAALVAAGCGAERAGQPEARAETAPKRACPAALRAGWQRLADRVDAPVYCPGWLPYPLTGQIGGPTSDINSVDPDRSYLIGFLHKEREEEIHVNLRGYPGRTRIPTCIDTRVGAGRTHRVKVPCFADLRTTKRFGALKISVYTVNRDADAWHVLYAWPYRGSLYALSEHVAPPYASYRRVVANLDRIMRNLALVEPRA